MTSSPVERAAPRRKPSDERPDTWMLQEAKARFSGVVRRARSVGPQRVTVRGREEVVIVSAEEWRRLSGSTGTGADLIAALQACPYPDFDLESPSVRSPVREAEPW